MIQQQKKERDERYLPFEGVGAISEWHIQLPRDFRQFDYETISDIVLPLRYTARDRGEPLKSQAITEMGEALNEFLRTEGEKGLVLPISLRHEFPSEWYRFLNPLPYGIKERVTNLQRETSIIANPVE